MTKQELEKDIAFLKEMKGYIDKLKNGPDIVALEMIETMVIDWWSELEDELTQKNKMNQEFFNPDLYKCWLTGNGTGQVSREKIPDQTKGYLERNK